MVTTFVLLLLLAESARLSFPFTPSPIIIRSTSIRRSLSASSTTALFGLLEWREQVQATGGGGEVTPLLLLPHSPSDILLPGQSSKLVLKEGRHFDMVDEALEEPYFGLIGQAVMGQDQLASTLSLCHITDTDVDSGYRGKITMTISIQSVGRATLEELLQLKPVPLGYCSELISENVMDWSTEQTNELERLQKEVEQVLAELDDLSPNDTTSAFQRRYKDTLMAIRRIQDQATTTTATSSSSSRDVIDASSWAVFAGLNAMENSFEPRLALESSTAMDRFRYGLERCYDIRATKQRQADQYSLLDDGVFE